MGVGIGGGRGRGGRRPFAQGARARPQEASGATANAEALQTQQPPSAAASASGQWSVSAVAVISDSDAERCGSGADSVADSGAGRVSSGGYAAELPDRRRRPDRRADALPGDALALSTFTRRIASALHLLFALLFFCFVEPVAGRAQSVRIGDERAEGVHTFLSPSEH